MHKRFIIQMGHEHTPTRSMCVCVGKFGLPRCLWVRSCCVLVGVRSFVDLSSFFTGAHGELRRAVCVVCVFVCPCLCLCVSVCVCVLSVCSYVTRACVSCVCLCFRLSISISVCVTLCLSVWVNILYVFVRSVCLLACDVC